MKRILFTAFAALLFNIIGFAQTVLPMDSTFRYGKLANGLTYYIRHNVQTPGQADFYIVNRVGSIVETPEQRGLAHFLEHMGFNGTKHFPDGNGGKHSIRNWCEEHGIKFGADLNASTSMERIQFLISNAPVGTSSELGSRATSGVTDTCMLILRDWAGNILLNDKEIDNERGVIREEWRTRRSNFATTRMMEDAMPFIYAGSKYEDALPIGHIEVVDTFHHEQLRKYYHDWFRPDLQAVIVVGDVNVDAIEAQIKSLFSDLKTPAGAPKRYDYNIPDNNDMIVYTQADDEQPTINMLLYMKHDPEPRSNRNTREAFLDDYKTRLAMFVLRQRLQQVAQEANPKIMNSSCRNGSFYVTTAKDAFNVNVGLMPGKEKEGIDAVMEVVEKLRRYGVTESELLHAKDQFTVSLEHELDNKDKTRNKEYVAHAIENFCEGEPLMNIEYQADLQGGMSETVTIEEVNETLKDIITDKNQVCIVFGPTKYDGKPFVMPAKDEFRKWVEQAEQRDYPDDITNKKIDYTFMKKLPKKGKIISKTPCANGYTEYLLSNGIKVSARPSTIEPNRLTINMFRLGGRSLYPDKDIMSLSFLNAVVHDGGAADFDFLMLEKKRRGKALRVTPYIDDEEDGVKGVCVASDFKTWLEVMYLYVTQPRRDDSLYNSFIARQESMMRNRYANPNVAYNDSLRYAVYGESERTKPISLERIRLASLDRIYEIYKERFSNMYGMNLIVTGDIREDEFEDLICQYVASLPTKAPSKKASAALSAGVSQGETAVGPYALDMQKGRVEKIYATEKKTPSALTNIFYSTSMPYSADNDLKADVLAQIMRAIYVEKVREDKGGTYNVSVSSQTWKYPTEGASLNINFRCAPEQYDALLPIIDQQLSLMAENGPTEEQLNNVKLYERKNYERAILTNGWWEYCRYHELREGVDYDKDYLQKVDALTPSDIRDTAKMFMNSGNRIQVTMK